MSRSRAMWCATGAIVALAMLAPLVLYVSATMPSAGDRERVWLVIVLPLTLALWLLRQALLPDAMRPRRWRVRNALGCLLLAMGVTTVIVATCVPAWIENDPTMFWGVTTGFALGGPAFVGGIATLAWGFCDWTAGVAPGSAPGPR